MSPAGRRPVSLLVAAATALLAVASVLTIDARPAAAQSQVFQAPSQLLVTLAARWCNDYTDIFANRARNDIMESLQNLGPDSPYGTNFTSVQPSVEDGQAPQSSCTPLPNWTFTLGTGIGRPIPGSNLSYVTNPGRQFTTEASTPLLDNKGVPTGSNIDGAVTFTLNAQEAALAGNNNQLWIQGGTPTDGLNGLASTYGFGALRCAKDNLNGDNVEWIAYPSGFRHVFCYAFYVKPPPASGVIKIVKRLATGLTATETFNYTGNLSFNPNGAFSLKVNNGNPATTEFVRGESSVAGNWFVDEGATDGWILTDRSCVSAKGTSTWAADRPTGITITLAGGDTITCTFTNDVAPPPSGVLRVIKTVLGDPVSGLPANVLPQQFDFTLSGQPDFSLTVDAGSTSAQTDFTLPPGNYTITEKNTPAAPGWEWDLESVYCAGFTLPFVKVLAGGSITVNLPPGAGKACTFTNRLVPTGGLVLQLKTIGGTGTFGFAVAGNTVGVDPIERPLAQGLSAGGTTGTLLRQVVTTAAPDQFHDATGVTADDSTNPLLGTWLVAPVVPPPGPEGRWVIQGSPSCVGVDQNPPVQPIGQEQLQVTLGTELAPVLTCQYTYALIPPGTLDLVKVVGGDLANHTQNVVVTATCDDGSSARLEMVPGTPSPYRLPTRLTFPFAATCAVTEEANGAAPGIDVTTTVLVTANGNPSLVRPSVVQIVNQDMVVQYTNVYPAVIPSTTAGPTTTIPVTLPPTGPPEQASWVVLVGAFGVLAGGTLVLARRRRA